MASWKVAEVQGETKEEPRLRRLHPPCERSQARRAFDSTTKRGHFNSKHVAGAPMAMAFFLAIVRATIGLTRTAQPSRAAE